MTLRPGQSLAAAVGEVAATLGITAGAINLTGASLSPVRYVMPTYARTLDHVAYYSDTYAVDAGFVIEFATATFGFRDGEPFLHCHALWRNVKGELCGGHILPLDTMLAAPLTTHFLGTNTVEMRAEFDPETNFTLFRPFQKQPGEGKLVVAHIRPNEDFVTAIERIAVAHGVEHGRIISGIGSTVGVVFEDGLIVSEIPTELLITDGYITPGPGSMPQVDVEMILIDSSGNLHRGRPARGQNPVLICAEIFIEILPAS